MGLQLTCLRRGGYGRQASNDAGGLAPPRPKGWVLQQNPNLFSHGP